MAKIKYTDFLGDLGNLRFDYTPDQMHTLMDDSGADTAVYLDEDGGEKIVLKGENFAYLDGDLLKGRVDRIIFRDNDGNTTATVSGADFKARQLDNLLTEGSDLKGFLEKVYGGRDKLAGTDNQDLAWAGGGNDLVKAFGGDDSLNGQAGNDVMVGGLGSDHFFFMHEGIGGKDVIKDFDANGGGDSQDYIAADFEAVLSIKQVGDDVVLDFGDGNTLTLLDTQKSNISEADFHIPL